MIPTGLIMVRDFVHSPSFSLGMLSSRDFHHDFTMTSKTPKRRRLGGEGLFVM